MCPDVPKLLPSACYETEFISDSIGDNRIAVKSHPISKEFKKVFGIANVRDYYFPFPSCEDTYLTLFLPSSVIQTIKFTVWGICAANVCTSQLNIIVLLL